MYLVIAHVMVFMKNVTEAKGGKEHSVLRQDMIGVSGLR